MVKGYSSQSFRLADPGSGAQLPADMTLLPRPATATDRPEWLRMRTALWPDDHEAEVDRYLGGGYPEMAVFVVEREDGGLCGFAEWGLRSYAEGCLTSPVGYLEGIWVDEDKRRGGVASALVAVGKEWSRGRGCTEVASDCAIDNEGSRLFHLAQGFAEVERRRINRVTPAEPQLRPSGYDGTAPSRSPLPLPPRFNDAATAMPSSQRPQGFRRAGAVALVTRPARPVQRFP